MGSIEPSYLPVPLSRILVVLALAAQIVVAWRYWGLTWDDSAITLGFSRTFALTGKIEPTPGSGIVEGYSTTLWMLLMTVAAKFASTPTGLLAIAKISSLLLNLANILLMRRWFLTWTNEICSNLIAGSIGCGLMFYETINGMETPLILALVLAMLLLLPLSDRTGRFFYLLAGSALLLTRWEAAWLLVPFVLVENSVRRAVLASTTWLTVFIVSNLVRWRYFGSILPNTVIAKRGVPYSEPFRGLEVYRHLLEPVYIVASCKVLIAVLAASLLFDRFVRGKREPLFERLRRALLRSWQLRFTFLFTLFALVLATAIGENWGPQFRSFYSAWPFLFCLLILPVATDLRSRALPWATVAICLFALLRLSVRVHELSSKDAPVYMAGATISNVASIDTDLTAIKTASHRQSLLFAGPDVGGILLYSDGIRVIDLGLLCDPVLARQRYAAIDSYVMQQRRPDVIEVHGMWTSLTNLHNSPLFRKLYRPVYVDGRRFFLSRNLIATIDPDRLTERSFNADGHPEDIDILSANIRYSAADDALNRDFGGYLVFQ